MLDVTVTVDGLDEFKLKYMRAVEQLEADVRGATLDAAGAGILAAQTEHPYQDHREPGKSYAAKGALGLTDTSHAEQPRAGSQASEFDAEMVWPAPYANFVDRGTSRNAAYPFTPLATETAALVLKDHVDLAIANFRRNAG